MWFEMNVYMSLYFNSVFLLFLFSFLARPVMIGYSLKDLASQMHSRKLRTLQSDTERAKEENGENIPSGCSVWMYVGMMSFVFTKPGLNLFLPFQNCSAEHLWRLLQTIFQAFESARCIKIQPIARGSLALPSLCLFPLPWMRVCCSCEVTAQRPPGPSCPAPFEAWRQASNGLKANLAQTRADFGQVFFSLVVKLQGKACLERMIWFGNFTFKLSCLFCSPCTTGEPSCEVKKETDILGCWTLGGGKRGSEFYSCNDLSQSKPISVCIFVEDNWEICTGERSLVQSQKSMG